MEPRRGPYSTSGPGVAHSLRIEGSGGLSRIPASLSIPSSAPTPGSAIMSSLASYASDGQYDHSFNSLASLHILNNELRSVDLGPPEKQCFKLINEKEELQVKNAEELLKKMGCPRDKDLQVKVVSIFGNTGEGKSYTMNQIFFKGAEVTSSNQSSCTLGVWGAYDGANKALVLDTEGMLGISNSSKQRKRLLLKCQMSSYTGHAQRDSTLTCTSSWLRRQELTQKAGHNPEEQLKENFLKQNLKIDGFNSLHYIGEHNTGNDTDFKRMRQAITEELQNNGVRSPRRPKIILDMLETINRKFSGQIQSSEPAFPDEYFTCTSVCVACQARCSLFMNHATHDGGSIDHEAERQCKYHHQFENKTSSAKDNTWLGLAKYAWAGYVLECEKCGIIYRSRQYWYGNESPDRCVVKEEFQHVWPGTVLGGAAHAGRQHCKMCQEPLDTIHHCRKCGEGFCDNCSDVKMTVPEMGWGDEPVRVCKNCYKTRNNPDTGAEEFLKDSTRPSYWIPDEIIKNCIVCEREFGTRLALHHCRACGQGVCDGCSPNLKPVKERGWDHPVRVCNNCLK
ncbi:Zinc finger FYVE domain-containing protein 1-like [Homarus americanus]|uniref:Zinc finger FYVE domain-containing protein 1-like n=1 Tax=Homarus americanus TaxID=6706 RepID=A0A8J5TI06_HOMAM|nr:Zinc finger FYVE domain-containing protein 1-like [Homarus americanus]